jgi:creatinine amidohydrolase
MIRSPWWLDLTTRDIAALPADTVALLPVAAVEQHGPHLPLGTDAYINRGIIARMLTVLPADVPVVILPEQTIGTSAEHLDHPGTLSHAPADLMRSWTGLLDQVAGAGLSRLILFNSHGGQSGLLHPVALDLRVRHGVMAVYASWFDAGYPPGLFSDDEIRHGLHGGAIETALMRHLHPGLVRLEALADFPSHAKAIEAGSRQLSANPGGGRLAGFGWTSRDLNPDGVTGNAVAGTAEAGRRLLDHLAAALAALVVDVGNARDPRGGAPRGTAP